MQRLLIRFALLLALLMPGMSHAVQPDEVLADPVLEARARALSAGLRCLVCQNQSIDDSDAPLARDLRILVRERLVGGDSDGDVVDFLVARYGDFILLKPPFKMATLLLWSIPVLALLAAAGLAVLHFRRRSATAVPDGLSAAEEAKLKRLMSDED
ncbi:MAG: cytochrome c-type biogenesis protein [Alphaproteobacteria bacterium]